MNIRNTAVAHKLDEVKSAIEEAEAIDIGGSRPQLEDALAAHLRLRDVIDSLVSVREETERNIAAIRRVLDLLDTPTTTSTEAVPITSLADRPVWQQAQIALRQVRRYMTAGDIAAAIRSLGGDPGKQATAGVSNGAKAHPEIFDRRGERGSYVFGLHEWETPKENELETEEETRD